MATRRIELKNLVVGLQDGFSGTGAVDDTLVATDTVMEIDTLDLRDEVTIVPVGVRFTTAGITTIRTISAANNSQRWTVTIDATGGTFTLILNGETTSNIAFDAAASAVQTALEALASVTAGDVVVSGSAGGPYTITLAGDLANTSGNTLTSDAALLTGGGSTATVATVHDGLSTWEITFTPAIATGSVPADSSVITFLPQRVIMKVTDGALDHTENFDPIFDYDQDRLDGTREGKEQPMDVTLNLVYSFLRASSGGAITPYEALHKIGGASTWVTAAATPCEPYCVDIFVEDSPSCGSEQAEVKIFPKFHKTSINGSVENATLVVSGKCTAVRPTITRVDAASLS